MTTTTSTDPTTNRPLILLERHGPPVERIPIIHPPVDPDELPAIFSALVAAQDAMLAAGEPPPPVPLAWIALCEMVGITVDLRSGRIVDGPKAHVPGMM